MVLGTIWTLQTIWALRMVLRTILRTILGLRLVLEPQVEMEVAIGQTVTIESWPFWGFRQNPISFVYLNEGIQIWFTGG
jgi:hypothetical protein